MDSLGGGTPGAAGAGAGALLGTFLADPWTAVGAALGPGPAAPPAPAPGPPELPLGPLGSLTAWLAAGVALAVLARVLAAAAGWLWGQAAGWPVRTAVRPGSPAAAALPALGRFRPTPFLPGLLQTLWTMLKAPGLGVPVVAGRLKREELATADGGRCVLHWLHPGGAEGGGTADQRSPPVMIVVPGLNGGVGDASVRHLAKHCADGLGWRCLVVAHRGVGQPVTSPHLYSAGFTGDLALAVAHARRRYPWAALVGCGLSLGGNVMCKFLAERAGSHPLAAAVSVSNPLDLMAVDEQMAASRFKRWFVNPVFVRANRRVMAPHAAAFAAPVKGRTYDWGAALAAPTVLDWDRRVTAPLFGFPSVYEYYRDASSAGSLHAIDVPVLLLHAEDDPVIPRRVYEVACEDALATDHVAVCLTACGGHVAHFEGLAAPRPWWLKPAGAFLGNAVAAARRKAGGPAAASAGKERASVERAGPTAGPPQAEPSFAFAAPPPGAALAVPGFARAGSAAGSESGGDDGIGDIDLGELTPLQRTVSTLLSPFKSYPSTDDDDEDGPRTWLSPSTRQAALISAYAVAVAVSPVLLKRMRKRRPWKP